MYILLNKDLAIARFNIDSFLGFEDISIVNYKKSKLYPWMTDLVSFIVKRTTPKERPYISNILKTLGVKGLQNYLELSHAISLNDTIWIKEEKSSLSWNDVSPYIHPFNTSIARAAFIGDYTTLSNLSHSLSPEFGTNGTFAKCWVRENGVIRLIKRGSEGFSNSGLEPYSEYYTSQVLEAFRADHIDYRLTMRNGKLASKCNLFTSEDLGLVPCSAFGEISNFARLVRWYSEHKMVDSLAEMIVADALIFNQDRHLGNFGCLFENNTGKIVKAAPLYDHNVSLFCYATDAELSTDKSLQDYISKVNLGPKLYQDFIPMAKKFMTPGIRRRLINMRGFKFQKHPRYNLSTSRLDRLSDLVNKQIDSLLKG